MACGLLVALASPARAAIASVCAAEQVPADSDGRLAEIMLQYDSVAHEELTPAYNDLFAALPTDVRVVVVCPTTDDASLFETTWGETERERGRDVRLVSVERPITIWARDRRIARVDPLTGQPASSIVPGDAPDYDEERRNDLYVSLALEQTGDAPGVVGSSISIEGGNVVANRRHVFVGANVYSENTSYKQDEPEITRELLQIFGRPFVVVRDSEGETPWGHVDMYITPVDDTTLLVASRAMADMLLSAAPNSVEEINALTLDSVDVPAPEGDVSSFESVSAQLASYGYRVLRLPAVADLLNGWMLTYNNVLMETRDGKRVVYMPVYGVPALDDVAESVYRSLDFDVRTIDVSSVFVHGGTVRCLANVTRRVPDFAILVDDAAPTPAVVAAAPSDLTAPTDVSWRDRLTPYWPTVILPLLIFLARVADVSIGTIRLICVARGFKILAIVLGFFEVLIWVTAVSSVLVHLGNWVNVLAYACGFSAGNALGLVIEQKLALGSATVTLISRFRGQELADRLRAASYRLTTMTGEGRDGPVDICMAVLPRRAADNAVRIAREVDPEVVITVEDVRHTSANSAALAPRKAPHFEFSPNARPAPTHLPPTPPSAPRRRVKRRRSA